MKSFGKNSKILRILKSGRGGGCASVFRLVTFFLRILCTLPSPSHHYTTQIMNFTSTESTPKVSMGKAHSGFCKPWNLWLFPNVPQIPKSIFIKQNVDNHLQSGDEELVGTFQMCPKGTLASSYWFLGKRHFLKGKGLDNLDKRENQGLLFRNIDIQLPLRKFVDCQKIFGWAWWWI